MSGAEAYFGEGARHSKHHPASHTQSGRRRKGGIIPFLPMIASAVAPSLVGFAAKKLFGGDGRPSRNRLTHHELGFQGLGDGGGDLADLEYFGSGTRKGMMRKTARRAYAKADADGEGYMMPSHTGGRRHRRGADADGDAMYHYAMGDAHTGGRRHRRGADADGEGRRKRKPSKRNMIVKQVMMEMGLSLPQASKYVKQHNLY